MMSLDSYYDEVRTRIAPSPTGFVHIGTLRTVLYDYFLAKQQGGSFVLRIEDTDQSRFVEGAIENLLETLKIFDIEPDEGPVLRDGKVQQLGEMGPYIQSERLETYREYVDKLIEGGHAYHCFCKKDRLDELRESQKAQGLTPKYDRKCCSLNGGEVKERVEAGEDYVVRLRIPEGETRFEDQIRGTVKFSNSDIDDQVLLKSDGFPTYHMAVVVDDYLMKISHVIRGEEWLSSTPKHIILYEALGLPKPLFAHVPLILNEDKKKLSKRQGDVAVSDFLAKGYLPDALFNFLATLGFNPSGDREIFSREELIELFDMSKVNKSGAVMNLEKLAWMNGKYIEALSVEDLKSLLEEFYSIEMTDQDAKLAYISRTRAKMLTDFEEGIKNGFIADEYDAEIVVWKKSDAAGAVEELNFVLGLLPEVNFEDLSEIEEFIKSKIEENGKQNGDVLWPLRVSLSGMKQSPGPFELLWALGQDVSESRIKLAIQKLESLL